MKNSINNQECSKCKLCIEVCPCNIISQNDDDQIYFIKEREHICLKCGQCMAICSTKAISIKEYNYEKDFIEIDHKHLNHDEFIHFLSHRRSVRNYKEQEVPQELIEKIIDSVSYAPYGASPESIEIVAINNRKKIESTLPKIEAFLDKIVKFIENPIISFMIKKKKGAETFNTIKHHLYPISKAQNYKLKFGDRITRGAPAIIVLHANKESEAHTNNAVIYATYIMMAAQAAGLGAMMNEIVPSAINVEPKIKEMYQIPKENEAVMSVLIGYPKYKYKRGIKRNFHKTEIFN